jgi:AcrR family transcriptional regulator
VRTSAPCGDATPAYFSCFVEGRRGEILDAALCVFAEKGYEGGTMREIATRLGVTEPALYRHYAGKEALFEDLVSVAGDHIVERASAMMERIEPENLRESLSELIQARRRHAPHDENSRPVLGTLLMASPHNEAFREIFRTHFSRPMVAAWEGLVPRVDAFFGIERSVSERSARVRAFLSLFVGSFMTSMMFDPSEDDAPIVDAMLAVMGWDAAARSGTMTE